MIQGYESVAGQPAWRSMRNMQLHPSQAVQPDGKIMSGNVYRRNIIYWHDPHAKYASFRTFPFDHNQCDENLIWHFGQPLLTGESQPGPTPSKSPLDEWASWQALGMDRHSLVADPLFVDAARDDYRLQPESPAWKLGFQPIPLDKIGPCADPLRATWPIVEAEGAREKPLVSRNP
jgi:hypothetical protein